jgi:hypothetical protein
MNANRAGPPVAPPVLLLGCGRIPKAAIRPGVRALAEAVRAARS